MIMHVTNKKPNQKLIQTLYEKSKNKLYYLAFDILQDENATEDAVCNCFIRLLEIYDLYSYTSYQQLERLAALLVRHLAYSMPEAQINSQDFCESGGIYRAELPLLALYYVYKLTPAEIGKLTGTSPALIRKKILSAQNRLF